MSELFGVMTFDLVDDRRTNGTVPPLGQQMINGREMRSLIADFLQRLGEGFRAGEFERTPLLHRLRSENPDRFMGLALGCLSDLCFNLEYVRRIKDTKWSYCNRHQTPRVYYPYLGVCPHCIVRSERPQQAALGGAASGISDEEVEDRRRYFGNKIESHHVGRIGERVFSFILDLLSKSYDPASTTGIVFDDQHDIDAVFFSGGKAILAQIKASPLVLMPAVVELTAPLTSGSSVETGLPTPRANHTFVELATAGHNVGIYLPLTDRIISLGPKDSLDWPYHTFRAQLTVDLVLDLLENWLTIYYAFEVPKRLREAEQIKTAWLTCGWGAPIDDNKTKAGLARSDNMMKGTYACLKYGAYYVQECERKTLRTALVSNIDPAHQYAEYLEKIEDVRWGHKPDFQIVESTAPGEPVKEIIARDKLTNLFDCVFTFNRRILNDPHVRNVWNLGRLSQQIHSGEIDTLLHQWKSHETRGALLA